MPGSIDDFGSLDLAPERGRLVKSSTHALRYLPLALLPLIAAFLLFGSPAYDPQAHGLALGGVSSLLLLLLIQVLDRRMNDLMLQRELMEAMVATDALTGLANRRALPVDLEREATRSFRQERPVTCLMVDLDGFKEVNDRHGHALGDQVLRLLASVLQEVTRTGLDVGYRVGGDEFVVILPDADEADGVRVAERLLQVFSQRALALNPALQVGLSVGAAELQADEEPEEWLARADAAMYVAKGQGGGCCGARPPVKVPSPRGVQRPV